MAVTSAQIQQWLQQNPGATDAQMFAAMNQHGVTPGMMAQATGVPIQQVQQRYNAQAQAATPQGQPMPPTGLAGYERALQGGFEGSLNAINDSLANAQGNLTNQATQGLAGLQQGLDAFNQRTDQAVGTLDAFAQPGQQAFNVQAALSGALGADQQAQAYQNFQSSPGQQYLLEQAEKAITRNASATGGLGGGRVLQELQRNAIGMAAQDFNNAFNRLGQVAQPGFQATGAQAGMQQGAGSAALQTGMAQNQTHQNLGNALAGMDINAGLNAANIIYGTGQQLGNARMQTGQQLAGAISDTTSALSQLRNQQGQGLSSIIGSNTGNLAQLLTGSGQNQAQMLSNLASLLGNISAGQGSQLAGLPGIPGAQQTGGILGGLRQLAGGIGGLLTGWNNRQQN